MITLGVNIDHIATIRNARGGQEPDPVYAAGAAEIAGADCITIHLREDRRHIQDRDLNLLSKTVKTRLNLEMAPTEEMQAIALTYKPYSVTLVPEKREELTTEGGLDVVSQLEHLSNYVKPILGAGIIVSMFIDPDIKQIDATIQTCSTHIELHTGDYAEKFHTVHKHEALERLKCAALYAYEKKVHVNAGHGLNYHNLKDLLVYVPHLEELNIGHSIIARAVFSGLPNAVEECVQIIDHFNTSYKIA